MYTKIILFVFFSLFIFSCNLIKPSTLIINNRSEYDIEVMIEKGLKEKMSIEAGAGDFTTLYPGEVNVIIKIDAIGYRKEYQFELDYQEKKQVKFILKEEE